MLGGMTVTPFPTFARAPIDADADIAALEGGLSALTGLVSAGGGLMALAGRDLLATPVAERARLLSAMYDDGEVVFGWRDGEGRVANVVVERLRNDAAVVYLAEIFDETADGHVAAGALRDADPAALMRALGAVAAGDRAALTPRGAALAAAMRDAGGAP